jgi:HK97 family phage prohead protease
MTTLDPYKFEIDGNSLDAKALDNGDLLLEGWAARWDIDREAESFDPASFDGGIKAFIDGTAALCWHHDHKAVLGRVLSLERRPEGLWMRCRVDRQEPGSPLRHIYNGIRKGSITGASVGGFFARALKAGRRTITGVDLVEVSLTAAPVGGHNTRLSVVAGKALAGPGDGLDGSLARLELHALSLQLDEMREAERVRQTANRYLVSR